jgi:hypothetical protein
MAPNEKENNMKKLILFLACLLFSGVVFADQTLNGRQPREWAQSTSENNFLQSGKQDYSDNTTIFTNLGVMGNQATGNAGYLILTAQDTKGNTLNYYLWMDATTTKYGTQGQLEFASFGLLTSAPLVMTSFPYGDWRQSTGFTSSYSVSSH